MNVVLFIFYLLLIVCTPLLSIFLIRMTLKLSKTIDRVAKTVDDARPQLNMLLQNLGSSLEQANGGLSNLMDVAEQAQQVMDRVEKDVNSIETALRSPIVKYSGIAAGFLLTSRLARGKIEGKKRRKKKKGGGKK